MKRSIRITTAALLAAGIVFAVSRPTRADSNIRAELAEVAKGISAEMKQLGKTKIEVKGFDFLGPNSSASDRSDSKLKPAAGPGLSQTLVEELQREKLTVEKGADLVVRGTYVDIIDKKSQNIAARIRGELIDSNDQTLLSFDRALLGDQALASIFGATTTITPTDDTSKRSSQLMAAIDNPTVTVENTRISATKGDPYHIEVLVLKNGQYVPRTPTTVDGQAFVNIERDEIYAIKLINDSASEASVALTVDGISMFTFSENKDYTQVIISAKGSGLIKGWHRSNAVSDAFQVMEYSKSAVAQKLPTSTSIGVVTAAFSVCFPDDVPPPEDEPPSTKVKGQSRSANATGRGPELKDKFNEVRRNFGVVRTTISVRYTK